MKWILASLFLGIIFYQPPAESSENHLQAQQQSCTYFSNLRGLPSDHDTEGQAPCSFCHPISVPQPRSFSVVSDVKEAVEAQPCCFVYTPLGQRDRPKNGRLSFYWAQELIGSDLLRRELDAKLKKEGESSLPENLIAVFDDDASKSDCAAHTEKVENLISHHGRHAILPQLKSRIKFYYTHRPEDYRNISLSIKESKDFPQFINNSMSWEAGSVTYEAFLRLSTPSVAIISSGNDYPQAIHPFKIESSKKSDIILVGSLNSNGFASEFSQQGTEVHILAPSGRELASSNDEGGYCMFGGTSGAAPLVTGSLAAFEWLAGYHPTAEEAKVLLEKTAIPTVHSKFENPIRNGHGLLNTYKLGKVAQRMKKFCENKTEGEKIQCFKQQIMEDQTYQFSIKEDYIYDQINNSFPECNDENSGSASLHISSCEEKQKALRAIRGAALIDPDRADLWKVLSCIYRNNGFTQNAKVLDRISWAAASDEEFLNRLAAGNTEDQLHWVRMMSNIKGEENERALKRRADDANTSVVVKKEIAKAMISLTETSSGKAYEILDILAKDTSSSVREEVAHSVGLLEGKEFEEMIRLLQSDSDESVRAVAHIAAYRRGMPDGIRELKKLIENTKDLDLREDIIERVKKIEGSDNILNLLNLDTP